MRRNMMRVAVAGGVLPLLYYPGDVVAGVVLSGLSQLNLDMDSTPNDLTQTVGDDSGPAISFAGGNSAFIQSTAIDSAFGGSDYLEFSARIAPGSTASLQEIFAKWDYTLPSCIACELLNLNSIRVYISTYQGNPGNTNITYAIGFTMNLGTEYDIKVIYDGSKSANQDKIAIYIDNVALLFSSATGTLPAVLQSDTSPLRLGNFGGSLNRPFTGRMQRATFITDRL